MSYLTKTIEFKCENKVQILNLSTGVVLSPQKIGLWLILSPGQFESEILAEFVYFCSRNIKTTHLIEMIDILFNNYVMKQYSYLKHHLHNLRLYSLKEKKMFVCLSTTNTYFK